MPITSTPKFGSWAWLHARLFPRGTNLIQWASFVILMSMVILYVLDPPQVGQFRYYSTLMALALLMVVNILLDDLKSLFPTERMGTWGVLLISVVLTFYTVIAGQMFQAIYIVLMISAQASAMLPLLPATGLSLLMAGIFLGHFAWTGASPGQIQSTVIGLLIGMTFTISLSQVLLRYSEQTERANLLLVQLQKANADLIAARQKEKELALAEERVRMARDLHDGLGHHLTALSIQLQAAEKFVLTKPEQAAEAVHNARGEVQAALKEVRQSVATLREVPIDYHDLPQSIAHLVEETGKNTDLITTFRMEGQITALSPTAAMTIYRAAQEGLTNILKHAAGAQHAQICLAYQEHGVLLKIDDDGLITTSNHDQTQGFGLAGLRERTLILGGTIEYGPRPESGYMLTIFLPFDRNVEEAQA